jgi:Asp/Glu/hydantoin racemase
MRVLLINPNSSPETTARMVAIAEGAAPGCVVIGMTAASGPRMIVDEAGLATGAASVAEMARSVRSAFDGAIVSAFGDPGLETASAILSFPVCGIGAASFAEAADGGRRFAVATTTPGLVAAIAGRVAAAGLSARFLGTWVTPGDPVATMADPARLDSLLASEIGRARADGAEAVIIGGGPLAEAARRLADTVEVPLIEPIPAAIRLIMRQVAAMRVRSTWSGRGTGPAGGARRS